MNIVRVDGSRSIGLSSSMKIALSLLDLEFLSTGASLERRERSSNRTRTSVIIWSAPDLTRYESYFIGNARKIPILAIWREVSPWRNTRPSNYFHGNKTSTDHSHPLSQTWNPSVFIEAATVPDLRWYHTFYYWATYNWSIVFGIRGMRCFSANSQKSKQNLAPRLRYGSTRYLGSGWNFRWFSFILHFDRTVVIK